MITTVGQLMDTSKPFILWVPGLGECVYTPVDWDDVKKSLAADTVCTCDFYTVILRTGCICGGV